MSIFDFAVSPGLAQRFFQEEGMPLVNAVYAGIRHSMRRWRKRQRMR